MKKFKFKLAPVLRVREHEEEQQKMRYAQALQNKTRLEEQAEEIKNNIKAINDRDIRNQDVIRPTVFQQHYAGIHEMHKALKTVNEKLVRAENEAEAERKKLVEANKRTKIIKTLESQEKETFFKELQRLEQEQLNEIATQMFNSYEK